MHHMSNGVHGRSVPGGTTPGTRDILTIAPPATVTGLPAETELVSITDAAISGYGF
jgi:hypothetical protein